MLAEATGINCQWLCTGTEAFAAMLAAIAAAQRTVSLETYIYAPGDPGDRVLAALVAARQRGVDVRVLVDGLGSVSLPASYWAPLEAAGGKAKVFNPIVLARLSIRDHRKILVCDSSVAFIGGYNIAPEYLGDGVTKGWCDVGVKLEGSLARDLQTAFDEMYARADFLPKPPVRLRKLHAKRTVIAPNEQLLLSGPGRGPSPLKRALRKDLTTAREVQIVSAYFLPTWRLRRDLVNVSRRGGEVRLILAGKSDVAVSQLAARSLYRRFLSTGIEIFEYQPQILHAKLFQIDDVAYVGSSNLDQRSLSLNFEVMIRFEKKDMADQARAFMDRMLPHCLKINADEWRESRSLWTKLKQRWAYFLLVRIDPYLARRQWHSLRD
jgi:cardiolipin synthase